LKFVVIEKADKMKTIIVGTVGVDFDGTIVKPNNNVPTKDCKLYPGVKDVLDRLKSEGWIIIIDSCRKDEEGMKKFLKRNKVPFDYVNENPLQKFMSSSTKIYTDIRIDDKAVTFRGWDRAYKDIIKRRKELDDLRSEGRKVLNDV